MLLMIGDAWAEDHHDVELEDDTGRRLSKARLPKGLQGDRQAACFGGSSQMRV